MKKQSKVQTWVSRVAFALLGALGALYMSPLMADGFIVSYNSGAASLGGTVTTPILFPDGTAGAPSIAFATDADGTGTGFYMPTTAQIGMTVNGTNIIRWTGSTMLMGATVLTFGTGPTSSTLILGREADAVLQLGADINGAAVDQTLSAADAITGADISGGDLTIAPGTGMGTGTVSALIFQTPTVAAAGANPQSLATRLTLNSALATFTVGLTGPNYNSDAGGYYRWTGRTIITASADGLLSFNNAAQTDFTRITLGPANDDHPAIAKSATVSGKSQGIIIQHADGVAPVFADLGAATNGSMIYCSDCTIANPCAGSGTGAIAKRLNGAWVCN